jgi:hypothetical protein
MIIAGQFLHNRNLLLMVLEAGSLKSRSNSAEGRLHTASFSIYQYMAEERRWLSGVSLIRALIPFMKAPPMTSSNPKHFPKVLSLLKASY